MSLMCSGAEQTPVSVSASSAEILHLRDSAGVPQYLNTYYWWAYVHPVAVKVFEHQWLVNCILWGNYGRRRDADLSELGERMQGRTLQVACAYGDLTTELSSRVAAGCGTLDVIDVLPVQLQNLRRKLPKCARVRLHRMDSTRLGAPDGFYDRAVVFFLLHEQPRHDRERTLSEVLRVVRPGGKIVIVDYALPRHWHPLRYLWRPLLACLEPFALDLWRREIASWLPKGCTVGELRKESFFGGLYQKVVITQAAASREVQDAAVGPLDCIEPAAPPLRDP